MYRTKQGLILEKILNDNKYRWLFCWNGEDDESESGPYDCACCMTWSPVDHCRCVCHTRIEQMAQASSMKLFLLAAEVMGELPRSFSSYEEKLVYSKGIADSHKDYVLMWKSPCPCEFCKFVREDNHVCSDEESPKV